LFGNRNTRIDSACAGICLAFGEAGGSAFSGGTCLAIATQ
jgi:hypothetical protein